MNQNYFSNKYSLSDIRDKCAFVSSVANHVSINFDLIEDYALSLPIDLTKSPPLDSEIHLLDQAEDTVAYFLLLETINFGSGYFPDIETPDNECGYFTMARSLRDYFINERFLTPRVLSTLSANDCGLIFNQTLSNPKAKRLMELFASALNELGQFVIKHFNRSYVDVIECAQGSAEKLVNVLIHMHSFRDISLYKSETIPFFKRAQITAADLSLAFNNESYGHFNDLDQLTIFADNMVPHVLHCDGLLTYDDELTSLINNGQLIPAGSSQEVEIRACAIHIVELIKAVLNEPEEFIRAIDLDYILWNRGLTPEYNKLPLHLTHTTFY